MNMNEGSKDSAHMMQMHKQGDSVMGFDQMKTTHHFSLTKNGGTIQVTANSADDTLNINSIRLHLGHIAAAFANGDFSMPMGVHSQIPPGVPTMQKLAKEIKYQFENIDRGGIVRITTSNKEALKAIHQFLQFQIREHKTGDSMGIQNK
jgi:hypothetical protein